ncbi:MAG TPA: sialidase family protein [Candidatus Acidoferrales bacterium]|nr:sialidase family protein [Candidatus Acidoferrales bacterium]
MKSQKEPVSAHAVVIGLVLLLLAAVPAAAQTLSVGPNVNINRQSGYQGEESIAIDPTNPNRLFAWANDIRTGTADNSAGYSTDCGVSWIARFTGTDGWPALGGDPTCSFDSFGNLFAASFDSTFRSIQVRASTNAGQTFSNLLLTITSTKNALDQPTIKAGPGTAAGQVAVWVMYLNKTALVARGAAVTGFNSFGAFGSELTIPGSGTGNFGDVAIGPNGQVAVAYQTPSGGVGPSTIQLAVNSTGNTADSFTLAAGTVTTQVGGFRAIPAQPSRTVDAELGLAYDISSGPHRGRLHLVYTDAPSTTSNDLNIFTRFSDNDGATWSSPVRVNTDTGTNSQFFSKIALDPTSGNIAMVWYDCRNSAANNRVELWGTVSLDGGVSFMPEVKISAGSTSGVGMGGGNELGDYLGLDFYNGVLHPAWADDSNSTGDNPDGTNNLDYYTAAVTLVPTTPVLTANGFGTNGFFTVKLASTPMTGFGIQASTNLVNWTGIGSGYTGTNGLLFLQDTNAGFPFRFYRGIWPVLP